MITEKPHIAGGEQNAKLAFLLYQQWQAYGFDDVKLYNYSVLLSYPDKSNPNILQIRDPSGLVDYNAGIAEEPPLTSGENDSNVVPPFNAYSGVGNASVSGKCACLYNGANTVLIKDHQLDPALTPSCGLWYFCCDVLNFDFPMEWVTQWVFL